MTTHHTRHRRRIAAVGAIIIAAISIATTTATTADARIKNGGADYDQCIRDAVKYNKAHGQTVDMNAIRIGCCAAIGGDVETEPDGLTFKNCIFHPTDAPGDSSSSSRRAAGLPPGATQIHPQ